MNPDLQEFPSFTSLDELVEFFDSHDMGEYQALPEAHLEVNVEEDSPHRNW